MLFAELSLWAMLRGIVLGGGALLMLAAALFHLAAWRPAADGGAGDGRPRSGRPFAGLLVAAAAALWPTVAVGTYVAALALVALGGAASFPPLWALLP